MKKKQSWIIICIQEKQQVSSIDSSGTAKVFANKYHKVTTFSHFLMYSWVQRPRCSPIVDCWTKMSGSVCQSCWHTHSWKHLTGPQLMDLPNPEVSHVFWKRQTLPPPPCMNKVEALAVVLKASPAEWRPHLKSTCVVIPNWLLSKLVIQWASVRRRQKNVCTVGRHSYTHLWMKSFVAYFLFHSSLTVPYHIPEVMRKENVNEPRQIPNKEQDCKCTEG